MKKVKKVNGFLVVEFNSGERRDYPDLGTYGVIDPELYTGDLDVDRGALEYDDADALDVALEQARGPGPGRGGGVLSMTGRASIISRSRGSRG